MCIRDRRLLGLNFKWVSFPACSYGSPTRRYYDFFSNIAAMDSMQDTCHCPYRGSHIQAQDTFTDDVLREFLVRCRPSSFEVYGREPRLGERIAKLAGCYPRGACRALADVNATYIRRPVRARAKPSFAPPLWVAELATSLDFEELFRYCFVWEKTAARGLSKVVRLSLIHI